LNEQLKYLIQLQALEDRKKALLKEKEEIPKLKIRKEREFQEFEAQYVMKKAELENLQKHHKDLEKEIAELERKLSRCIQKEREVKTNEEYRALLKEQEYLKVEIVEKEDKVLECMERVEILSKEVKRLGKEVEERRSRLKQELTELDEATLSIDAKVEAVEKAQKEIKEKLDPQVRRRCESLMARQGGIAVAPVEKGICKVCHVSLPPQQFIELQKDTMVMNCPHCHRFIYWPGHEVYIEAAKEIIQETLVVQ